MVTASYLAYMQGQIDDITVIQQVLQGQQSAYSQLVHKYEAYVFTLVLRYESNRENAEELAQDVFIKAYRCLGDFKGQSKFSTWLYTIVNTTCLSYHRKKKDETIFMEEDALIAAAGAALAYRPSSEAGQQTAVIETALKQLPPDDARVLTLFYTGEQSVEEISRIIGISVSNVKVRLFRARQKLRDILEPKLSNDLK